MSDEYIEALLLWNERGSSEQVLAWLREHSFEVLPMRAGLLVTASRAAFESGFQVNLDKVNAPVSLPVPPDLQANVASVTIPEPRHLHEH